MSSAGWEIFNFSFIDAIFDWDDLAEVKRVWLNKDLKKPFTSNARLAQIEKHQTRMVEVSIYIPTGMLSPSDNISLLMSTLPNKYNYETTPKKSLDIW